MEQRVQDLIEQLQRYDSNTRIEGCVNLKWNDKRTALVVSEIKHLENELKARADCINVLREEISRLEDEA